jgi:hypothetical protein
MNNNINMGAKGYIYFSKKIWRRGLRIVKNKRHSIKVWEPLGLEYA